MDVALAFSAASELPGRGHEALIKRTHEVRLVGHISRDNTAIEAREKPLKVSPPTGRFISGVGGQDIVYREIATGLGRT